MERNDMPVGFSFALAQNPSAMKAFAHMSEEKQQQILFQAHHVSSKAEMKALVNRLSH